MAVSISLKEYTKLIESSPVVLKYPEYTNIRTIYGGDTVVTYKEVKVFVADDGSWYDSDGLFYSLEEVVNYCVGVGIKKK